MLTINDTTWKIEPQCLLDAGDGVSVNCKPDFMFWTVSDKNKKPVAIFTDGFIDHTDEVSEKETMTSEKYLLYVALTRTQKDAYITSYGKKLDLLM